MRNEPLHPQCLASSAKGRVAPSCGSSNPSVQVNMPASVRKRLASASLGSARKRPATVSASTAGGSASALPTSRAQPSAPRKHPASALQAGASQSPKRIRSLCACGKVMHHSYQNVFYCRSCFRTAHPAAARAAAEERARKDIKKIIPLCACGKTRQHSVQGVYYCRGCFRTAYPAAAKAAAEKRVRKQEVSRKDRACSGAPALCTETVTRLVKRRPIFMAE